MDVAVSQFTTDDVDVDSALNNSNKVATVPAGEEWLLQAIFASLITTATVGARRLGVLIDDGTNTIYHYISAVTQAASLTYQYSIAPGVVDSAAVRTQGAISVVTLPLPGVLRLKAGYRIRVYDTAAIDAAADDMTVNINHLTTKIF